jgi:hypothetical protein
MIFHSQGSGLHVITAVIGVLYVGGGADEKVVPISGFGESRCILLFHTLFSIQSPCVPNE